MNDGRQITFEQASTHKHLFDYIQSRQYGMFSGRADDIVKNRVASTMPGLFQERQYKLGTINKIFASKWLNHKHVIFGTKCNTLSVMDVRNNWRVQIPTLRSSRTSVPAVQPCGIHSIAINPSHTLLATGGENTNDMAVYQLPTFDPLCVGECAHSDWIFDIVWLNDLTVVTGSRDSKLAVWHIPKTTLSHSPYYFINSKLINKCEKAEKVRALSYNDKTKEMGVVSLNSHVHLWDMATFRQVWYMKLPNLRETVCLTLCKDSRRFIVGSQSNISFVDPRQLSTSTVECKEEGSSIRSLSINEHILTIGTGVGILMFFDMRANKYLEPELGRPYRLTVGNGWVHLDEEYPFHFLYDSLCSAIYSHNYDDTGTRLFVAGGPLPSGLWGNYAGLWS